MYAFKIWNQGNDGNTMGIRAADISVVSQIGSVLNNPSDDGVYASLGQYLSATGVATSPISPYRRSVDVLWRTAIGYGSHRYFPDRVMEVTRTGNVRGEISR